MGWAGRNNPAAVPPPWQGGGVQPHSPVPEPSQAERRRPLWQSPPAHINAHLSKTFGCPFYPNLGEKATPFLCTQSYAPAVWFFNSALAWGTCEVHPTHLGVGHYLSGKLEQVRPVGHLRPGRDVPAWCSPTCCSVRGCCGCPVAPWVCRFAASTGEPGQ